MEINFYYIKNEYIDYLKRVEIEARGFTCVPNTQYSSRNKFLFGACFESNGINYFVPVSHQIKQGDNNIVITTKPKKRKSVKLGSLRFAYMIPVPNNCLVLLNIKKIPEYEQKRRINDELAFCRRSIDKIKKQAVKTYDSITSSTNKKLLNNSCDFKLLEEAYITYCQENNIELPKTLQERIDQTKPEQVSRTGSVFSPKQLSKNAAKISEKHDRSHGADKNKDRNKPDL